MKSRTLQILSLVMMAGLALASCQPQVVETEKVVVVTQVVRQPVEVEKVVEVEKIVQVEKPVEVEKIVEKIIEKEVEVEVEVTAVPGPLKKEGGTLIFGTNLAAEFPINPVLKTNRPSIWLFDTLVELDGATVQPIGSLAKSWDISDDGTVTQIHCQPINW